MPFRLNQLGMESPFLYCVTFIFYKSNSEADIPATSHQEDDHSTDPGTSADQRPGPSSFLSYVQIWICVFCVQNEELELQYKTSYARILDAKRKFLEASQRYYELSQIGNREINGLQV